MVAPRVASPVGVVADHSRLVSGPFRSDPAQWGGACVDSIADTVTVVVTPDVTSQSRSTPATGSSS